MARRTGRLTVDALPGLAGGCGSCVFWQLDPVRAGRAKGHEPDELAAWTSEVLRSWGSCGRIAYVDDEPVGHVLYAPAALVAGSEQFPTSPVSPDAVLLVALHVEKQHRGGGIGRLLVQAMAKDLITRGGIRAVEAYGTHLPRRTPCVVPADFLARTGFRTLRAHPRTPRMRMDLRSALTWREEIEAAVDRLLAPVRGRQTVPQAGGRRTASRSSSNRSTPVCGSTSGAR